MDAARLRRLLDGFSASTILVVGDFFLDKYLDIDPRLSEPSLETGLEAYQVVGVRTYPGAAGTVVNNLRELEVNVVVLGVIGEDGEGDDLLRGLARIGVDGSSLIRSAAHFTPTYLKPMLASEAPPARELNRLDTKNRLPLPADIEAQVINRLRQLLMSVQACVQGVIVSDQVSEPNCGVITNRVRGALSELARSVPAVIFAADSRERIGEFRDVIVKPNAREAARATGLAGIPSAGVLAAGRELRRRTGRPVVVTDGQQGAFVFDQDGEQHVPAIPVAGPIDVVGAGDSVMAGLVAALCAGASLAEAALVGNLAASITIQQLGTTGTASRAQVLARFEETHAQTLQP
jgi:rfaE bifunctional protein kinase chain/domain